MSRSRWFSGGAIFLLLLLFSSIIMSTQRISFASKATTATPQVALGPVAPQVASSQLLQSVNLQQTLSLNVSLRLNHVAALRSYLQALYTPGSYLYHRYMRPADFAAAYGPTAQETSQVSAYLRGQGFRITRAVAGEQVLDFNGTVAQVEQAFGVQMNTYRARDGHVFFANNTPPRVPAMLSPFIQHISGLDNSVVRSHPPLPAHVIAGGNTKNTVLSRTDARNVACPGTGSQYYTPSQFASAYNFSSLYSAGYHGEGQRVALFELDSMNASDISAYQSCFDAHSPTRITTTQVDGGTGSPGVGGLEVELDAEVLLGMLPGLSNLTVYEAPNTDTGYNDEWMQILRDDIPVVSTSWGTCEAALSSTDIAAEEQFFLQAAAQGQALLAASGDNGAYDCGDSSLAVDDPASNPYMTGIGGTHLTINSNGSYNSESSWSNSPDFNNGSGGGVSQLWAMPAYQSGTGVVSSYSNGTPCHAANGSYCREVPDIAFDADPATGYVVYCTIAAAGCSSSAPFVHIGGTSAAAPMEAAVVALANQYLLAHNGNNLGFLTPTLYTLLHNSTLYAQAFHDVKSGSNRYYPATTGYDMATGIGTANADGFALAVASLSGARSAPAQTRWYFAEGHLGNGFQEYITLENPNASATAHVTINYLLRGRNGSSQSVSVAPGTRMTIDVNKVFNDARTSNTGLDVSLLIATDTPIVAERPIYFTYNGTTTGGSDIIGTTQLGQQFTFANGETLPGYSTYLTVLNPPGQAQATITANYYSGGGSIGQSIITVPAGQRGTILVNNSVAAGKQFLLQVDSSQPVVIERPMYFHTIVSGITGSVIGGDSVQGVTAATNWYFADGNTGSSGAPSRENLILANPNTGSTASVSVVYALASGGTKTVTLPVPALSQVVENVNADVQTGTLVSIKVSVTNAVGIVAERQQFFSFSGLTPTPTGVEVVGTQNPASLYSFAEGHLANSFSEYVTLFNPNSSAAQVAVTCILTQGGAHYLSQLQVSIAGMGVAQVSLNSFLNMPAGGANGSADVSLVVQSLPPGGNGAAQPIVAERSLYFNYNNVIPGSTTVTGYSGG